MCNHNRRIFIKSVFLPKCGLTIFNILLLLLIKITVVKAAVHDFSSNATYYGAGEIGIRLQEKYHNHHYWFTPPARYFDAIVANSGSQERFYGVEFGLVPQFSYIHSGANYLKIDTSETFNFRLSILPNPFQSTFYLGGDYYLQNNDPDKLLLSPGYSFILTANAKSLSYILLSVDFDSSAANNLRGWDLDWFWGMDKLHTVFNGQIYRDEETRDTFSEIGFTNTFLKRDFQKQKDLGRLFHHNQGSWGGLLQYHDGDWGGLIGITLLLEKVSVEFKSGRNIPGIYPYNNDTYLAARCRVKLNKVTYSGIEYRKTGSEEPQIGAKIEYEYKVGKNDSGFLSLSYFPETDEHPSEIYLGIKSSYPFD